MGGACSTNWGEDNAYHNNNNNNNSMTCVRERRLLAAKLVQSFADR
jgi:hypothetical protein